MGEETKDGQRRGALTQVHGAPEPLLGGFPSAHQLGAPGTGRGRETGHASLPAGALLQASAPCVPVLCALPVAWPWDQPPNKRRACEFKGSNVP